MKSLKNKLIKLIGASFTSGILLCMLIDMIIKKLPILSLIIFSCLLILNTSTIVKKYKEVRKNW